MPARNVRGRLVYWKISQSQQLAKVSVWAKLLFTWLIPNVDNLGRADANPYIVKGIIFPLDQEISPERCGELLKELHNIGLIILYNVKGLDYFCIPKITNYQKLMGNMIEGSDYPAPKDDDVRSWEHSFNEIYNCTYKYQPDKNEVLTEGKGKGKGKINTYVQSFFAYFIEKTKKNLKLTPERSAIIKKRFNDGRTLEELKRAVDNFVADDWAERERFTDIIYCIGVHNKVDNLDKWLNFKPKTRRMEPKPKKGCTVCGGSGNILEGSQKGARCFCY
jgi:uncharacterized phage protein (TIGR02220 family)